jgi:two-component system KDP operon response regulator KdpE
MAAPLIGIADHDPVLMRLLDQVLTEAGFQTIQLPEGAKAYEEIKKRRPDLILLDTWLESREAGWILFQVLRLDRETREIPVLICSSDLEEYEKRAAALEEHSRVAVLNKPFDINELIARVEQLLTQASVPAPGRDGHSPE